MGHYVFNQGTLPIKAWMKLNLNHNAAAAPPRAPRSALLLQDITLWCSWDDESHKCEQMLVIFGCDAKFIPCRKILCSELWHVWQKCQIGPRKSQKRHYPTTRISNSSLLRHFLSVLSVTKKPPRLLLLLFNLLAPLSGYLHTILIGLIYLGFWLWRFMRPLYKHQRTRTRTRIYLSLSNALLRGSHSLSDRRAQRTKSRRPTGPPTRLLIDW